MRKNTGQCGGRGVPKIPPAPTRIRTDVSDEKQDTEEIPDIWKIEIPEDEKKDDFPNVWEKKGV
jgi:hypothetical protein